MAEDEEHEFAGTSSLLFVLIVLTSLFSGKLIDILQFHYITESTISIILGLIVGFIILLLPTKQVQKFVFDPQIFFFVLLPPIVFEAGFSLRRKSFFRNMGSILVFAIVGTVISTLIIAMALYGLSAIGILPLYNNGNPLECLLFGALISAVDPVGTLAVLGKKEFNVDQTLYSLIFGESVLNDAVAIVLFKILNDYSGSEIAITFEAHFGLIFGKFLGIFIGSFLVGTLMGLASAALLRHTQFISSNENTWIQFLVIILFAYVAFSLGEVLQLSGIVAVFFAGICMAHYSWYNLTWIAQVSAHHVVKAMSKSSENFVYVYLGISTALSMGPHTVSIFNLEWNFAMIFFASILCVVARAFNTFPLSLLLNCGRTHRITFNMQIMMWFAGLRGAIAFAMALNLNSNHHGIIVTTTLSIVCLTTVICGCTTQLMLKQLRLQNSTDNDVSSDQNPLYRTLRDTDTLSVDMGSSVVLRSTDASPVGTKGPPISSAIHISPEAISTSPHHFGNVSMQQLRKKFRKYTGVHRLWHDFDIKYMQKWFGGSTAVAMDTQIIPNHAPPPLSQLEMRNMAHNNANRLNFVTIDESAAKDTDLDTSNGVSVSDPTISKSVSLVTGSVELISSNKPSKEGLSSSMESSDLLPTSSSIESQTDH